MYARTVDDWFIAEQTRNKEYVSVTEFLLLVSEPHAEAYMALVKNDNTRSRGLQPRSWVFVS